jgi:ferritin-like metal-binding protein YciE
LKNAITDHLHETEEQVKKLERVFELIGEKAQAKKCEAMEGLVDEASGIIDETEKETYTRDAALIMAAQKVEHYEIATYGSLAEFARTMGHDDVVSILEEILEEEKEADKKLNELATGTINEMARSEWTEEMHHQ